MSNLPNELVDEILLRLPPKSLMRFKSVSHAWKKKIGSVEFVKNHKDLNKKDSKKVMICERGGYHSEPLAYSLSLNLTVECVSHNFSKCLIVGSCDGLLLVKDRYNYNLCIWNPYTRECRDLLRPHDFDFEFDSCMYGFGCASSLDKQNRNNYKVLFIREKTRYELEGEKNMSEVALYTTHTNSCARLKDIPYKAFYGNLVLLNAKLHFFVEKSNTEMQTILAFDIKDEEFKEIPCPDDDDSLWYSVVELNGNLCVVVSNEEQYECMWVMKEYGVKESWINMFRFNLHNLGYPTIHPLHLYRNNRMLVHDDFDQPYSNLLLMSHDDSGNVRSETLKLDKVPSGKYKAVAYEETLLSPNAI